MLHLAPETEDLVRLEAARQGKTEDEVIRAALNVPVPGQLRLPPAPPRQEISREEFFRRMEEIGKSYRALVVLDDRTPDEILGYDEFGLPTIFAFTLQRHGAALPLQDCKDIHRALGRALADEASPVAAQICLIGQPVGWGGARSDAIAALRICIGARHITEAWSADAAVGRANLQREIDRVATVVAKIEWLVGRHSFKREGAPHGN